MNRLGWMMTLAAVVLGLILGGTWWRGRAHDAEDRRAIAAQKDSAASWAAARRSDSLRTDSAFREVAVWKARAAAAAVVHARSVQATDLVRSSTAVADTAAAQLLADTMATVPALRGALSLAMLNHAAADSAFLEERSAAALRIMAIETALAIDSAQVIPGLQAQIFDVKQELDHTKRALATAEQMSRPPWYRRAIGGLTAAAAGGACGYLGFLAGGPLAAVGVGGLCAAVASVARP